VKITLSILLLSGFSAFASGPKTQYFFICKKPAVAKKSYQVSVSRASYGSDLKINVLNFALPQLKSETTRQISVGYYGAGINYISENFKLHISTTTPLIKENGRMYASGYLQNVAGTTVPLLCQEL
jgi:hypothetical protein